MALRDGCVLASPGQHQAESPADGNAAPDYGDVSAGDRHVVLAQQRHDAFRSARQRAGLAEHELAQVDGLESVGILGRIDEAEYALRVQAGGQRKLDDESGAGRIGVQVRDRILDLLLRRVGWQVLADAVDPDLRAVPVLPGDVGHAARIVADQHGPQARRNPRLGEVCHPQGQIFADSPGCCLAVQNRRCHRRSFCPMPAAARSAGPGGAALVGKPC